MQTRSKIKMRAFAFASNRWMHFCHRNGDHANDVLLRVRSHLLAFESSFALTCCLIRIMPMMNKRHFASFEHPPWAISEMLIVVLITCFDDVVL